jgi:hypothetical protein
LDDLRHTVVFFLIKCECATAKAIQHPLKNILMRANSLTNWPSMIPEGRLMAKTRSRRPAVVKRLMPPAPPDEVTVRQLNALAAKQPFCALHRVRKHDML